MKIDKTYVSLKTEFTAFLKQLKSELTISLGNLDAKHTDNLNNVKT